MHWLGLILVIRISILNLLSASDDICPPSQYLNGSGVCVPCGTCLDGPKKLVLRPCSGHADTVCGSVYDLSTPLPGFPRAKKRRGQSPPDKRWSLPASKGAPKKLVADDDAYYRFNSAEYEDGGDYGSSRTDGRRRPEPVRPSRQEHRPEPLSWLLKGASTPETISGHKQTYQKNGKHIKKDLSMADGRAEATSNRTGPSEPAAKSGKAAKAKPKKSAVQVNGHPVEIAETKVVINGQEKKQSFTFVHPHIVDHKIYLEMEGAFGSPKAGSLLAGKRPKLSRANSTSPVAAPKNSTDVLQFRQLMGAIAGVFSNDTRAPESNSVDGGTKNGVLPESSDYDDDYLADETEDDDDDDDEDEDDDGDDEDDDDDDDDDDDEDDEDEEDEDEDAEDDDSLLAGSGKSKRPAFGGSSNPSMLDDDDDEDDLKVDDDEDDYGVVGEGSSKKWPQADGEVNVEPYSSSPDWQLLMLVSLVSACLLFFVFVNVYICIYMRRWKSMKSNFEADVEDLSVRINLMQHAGLETEDQQHYIKNYVSQLKSGRTEERLPKASLREK